jgi:BirA family biotin operon repressor/biotin-[acetyl-CoA-carboxylase] ligase
LAGILVEVLPAGLHILGLGLNTNNRAAAAPAALQAAVTTLLDLTGRETDHAEYLIDFLAALETRLRQLAADAPELGAALDELCLQHGDTLTVYLGDELATGRCAGIAPDGALLLDTPDGRRAFYSGTLRPPGGDRRGFA